MQFDLLACIELTVSAAIVVVAMAVAFGTGTGERLRIAGGLGLWFAVVVLMAATRFLTYPNGLGVPGLGLAVALPILVLTVAVKRSPALFRALQTLPLHLLIGVHAVRVLGVSFLLLYVAGRLPAPFAPVAGWGDLLAGLAALPIAWQIYRQNEPAWPLAWIWNMFGLLDLFTAVALGATSSPGPIRLFDMAPGTVIMTTLPWLIVPGFIVPLLICTHFAVFYRLARMPHNLRAQTSGH